MRTGMIDFDDFLTEQDELRTRSKKTGRAVDEDVYVTMAQWANDYLLEKGKKITLEALLAATAKAAQDPNHPLSYKNAPVEAFYGKDKRAAGTKASWQGLMEEAAYSFAKTVEHPDFKPYIRCKTGYKVERLGNLYGTLSQRWKDEGIKGGSTATAKTDIAFTSDCADGIFTASMKDESGGALITSADRETAAIAKGAVDDILPLLNGYPEEDRQYLYKKLDTIKQLQKNDDNAAKVQQLFDDFISELDQVGRAAEFRGAPSVSVAESFLRQFYAEALTGRHKFTDKEAIASHLLHMAGKDKAKFENIDEHMMPFYKADEDGWISMLNRKGGYYGVGYGIKITLGKGGKRGAQPAICRFFPVNFDRQKEQWLHTQDDNIARGDFEAYMDEFGYDISEQDAMHYWDKRKNVLSKAMDQFEKTHDFRVYQADVGYKTSKKEINQQIEDFRNQPGIDIVVDSPPPEYDNNEIEPNYDSPGTDKQFYSADEIAQREGKKPKTPIVKVANISQPRQISGRGAQAAGKPESIKRGNQKAMNISKGGQSQKSESKPTRKLPPDKKKSMSDKVRNMFTRKSNGQDSISNKPKRDLEAIMLAYTTSRASVEEIGRRFGVPANSIKWYAGTHGWHRPRI